MRAKPRLTNAAVSSAVAATVTRKQYIEPETSLLIRSSATKPHPKIYSPHNEQCASVAKN